MCRGSTEHKTWAFWGRRVFEHPLFDCPQLKLHDLLESNVKVSYSHPRNILSGSLCLSHTLP